MIKVGVLLSGLGYGNGSDIPETILTALYLSEAGVEVIYLAPEVGLSQPVTHGIGKSPGQQRDILRESTRLSSGPVVALDQIQPQDLDALIIPGGPGAVKTLCDFQSAGEGCRVHEGVRHLVGSMVRRKRPVGVSSTAVLLLARILRNRPGITATLTAGNDAEMAGKIQAMGSVHVPTRADEAVVDEHNRLVSTSGSSAGGKMATMAQGIQNLVRGVLELLHAGENDARGDS